MAERVEDLFADLPGGYEVDKGRSYDDSRTYGEIATRDVLQFVEQARSLGHIVLNERTSFCQSMGRTAPVPVCSKSQLLKSSSYFVRCQAGKPSTSSTLVLELGR